MSSESEAAIVVSRNDAATDSEQVQLVDNVALYKSFCMECNCRPNSAVVKFLSISAPKKPPTALQLSNNYVGPKGFVPILKLITTFQTIETLDLASNGLTNEIVATLCSAQVLGEHRGVRTLDLSGNPITIEGGKHIIRLLESNRRIVQVKVENTDIFLSLSQRIHMAADENAKLCGTVLPSITPAAVPSADTVAMKRLAGDRTDIMAEKKRPTTANVVPVPKTTNNTEKDTPTAAILSSTHDAGGRARPATGRLPIDRPQPFASGSGAPKPRPPPPAIASRDTARLPEEVREEVRQKLKERAMRYEEVEVSAATKAADSVRKELMLLQFADKRYQRRVSSASTARLVPGSTPDKASASSGSVVLSPPSARRGSRTALPPVPPSAAAPAKEGTSNPARHPVRAEQQASSPKSVQDTDDEHRKDREPLYDSNGTPDDEDDEEELRQRDAEDKHRHDDADTNTDDASLTSRQVTAAHQDYESSTATKEERQDQRSQFSIITKDEQFRELFDMGCQHYRNKMLDAAYMCWNEAMELASQQRNREWIAVITNNLQRLSYEVLVADGTKNLDSGELEVADQAFSKALDLAVAAKNAAWESEMRRARKNVQHSSFQSLHEKATRIFEDLLAYRDIEVSAGDDRFEDPTDPQKRLKQQTSRFVNEWGRMLLLKEAVERWSEAMDVTSKLGGSSSKVLQDVIRTSAVGVTAYMARRFLCQEQVIRSLPFMNIAEMTSSEARDMLELCIDLSTKTRTLKVRVLDGIIAALIGNLYIATHQLQNAVNKFDDALTVGQETNNKLLMAAAHTMRATALWQRSNFTQAEKDTAKAIDLWTELREEKTVNAKKETQDAGDRGRSSTGTTDHHHHHHQSPGVLLTSGMELQTLLSEVSLDYLDFMLRRTYWTLVCLLVGSYRYKEALVMQERALLHRFNDPLRGKVTANFASKPTLDHITAVASALNSPLMYLETYVRFEWNEESEKYEMFESLLIWVVPKSADIKFVQIEVTKEFKVDSIATLIKNVRDALIVDPISTRASNEVILVPDVQWKHPLRLLYKIIVDPVVEFLLAHTGYDIDGVFTVIPSGFLWAVPFPALICNSKNSSGGNSRRESSNDGGGAIQVDVEYLGEKFVVQHCFSALHATYSALSATRSKKRHMLRDIVVVQQDTENLSTFSFETRFPMDPLRSTNEGDRLKKVFAGLRAHEQEQRRLQDEMVNLRRHGVKMPTDEEDEWHTGTVYSSTHAAVADNDKKDDVADSAQQAVVSDLVTLIESVRAARLVHFATTSTEPRKLSHAVSKKVDQFAAVLAQGRNDSVSATVSGINSATDDVGLCIGTSYDTTGLLRAADLATMEMAPELVSFSNSNLDLDRLRGSSDGVMCLARAALGAGAPCVIAAQWCTPDMVPSEFFSIFYHCLKRQRHKARALAHAMRRFVDSQQDTRYMPRLWAAYMAVGVGDF